MTREASSHLRELDENLGDWRSYLLETPRARFVRDRRARHALLHCVIVSLQAAIDVANHWAAALTPRRPETYRGVLDLLEENGAIPAALAADLRPLFSLRNVLIHKYFELDLRRLHAHLVEGPAPLWSFMRLAKAAGRRPSRRPAGRRRRPR